MTPARAPLMPSVIRRPWRDYSCYARIENRSDVPMRLLRFTKDAASYWVVPPPPLIAPHSRANIWVQDTLGVRGSAGRFTYTDGTRTLEFDVGCPTGGPQRRLLAGPSYRTRTGSSAWRTGGVNWSGHPVQARFFVEAVRTAAAVPAGRRPGAPAQQGELADPADGAGSRPGRRRAHPRPALGFRAVVARRWCSAGPVRRSARDRRAAAQRPPDAQRRGRGATPADRPLGGANAPPDRPGQPGSFSAAELTVRSGAKLTRPQKDDRADAVAFGGDRYEACIVASLSRAVRDFYARQGLRHLHEIRVSEAASGRLADGQYHVLWNGTAATGSSDEMRMLVDTIAVPRRDGHRGEHGGREALAQADPRVPGRRVPARVRPAPPAPSGPRLAAAAHGGAAPRLRSPQLRQPHGRPPHGHAHRRADRRVRAQPVSAPDPMSAAGGRLRYRGAPVLFNNWNRTFCSLYDDAKNNAKAILITGDLIDYGRGHLGLVNGGRHRHELGVDGAYHRDRNWFLFYDLLASGSRYCQPVYTSLGNHDWRSCNLTRRSRPALPIPRRSSTTTPTSPCPGARSTSRRSSRSPTAPDTTRSSPTRTSISAASSEGAPPTWPGTWTSRAPRCRPTRTR